MIDLRPPVIEFTEREKEILNPVAYGELKRRGLFDTQICLRYHIREEAMKKFKKNLKADLQYA